MGILNALTNAAANYGDDIVRNAANQYGDDIIRGAANKADDVLRGLGVTKNKNGQFIANGVRSHDADKSLWNKLQDLIGSEHADPDYFMSHRPTQTGFYADDLTREGFDNMALPKDIYDNPQYYTYMYGETPDVMNETMAQLNAVRGNPNGQVKMYRATTGNAFNDGDWVTLSPTYAEKHLQDQLGGNGRVISQNVNVRDIQHAGDDLAEWGFFPQERVLPDDMQTALGRLLTDDEMVKLYRGISAENDDILRQYIDDMLNPNIPPTTYGGGSAYGNGYYFTPFIDSAEYHASKSGNPSTAILEINVPKNRFTKISKELKNRPADFDLAAIQRGVPENIRFQTGVNDFNKYIDDNGFWGTLTNGEQPDYLVMRNDGLQGLRIIGGNNNLPPF